MNKSPALFIAMLLVMIAVVAHCDEEMTVEDMQNCIGGRFAGDPMPLEALTAKQVEALGLNGFVDIMPHYTQFGTSEIPTFWETQDGSLECDVCQEAKTRPVGQTDCWSVNGAHHAKIDRLSSELVESESLRKQVKDLSAEVEILKANFIVYENIIVFGQITQASGESTFNHLNVGSGSVSGFFSAWVLEGRGSVSAGSLTIRGVDIPSDLPARVEALEAASKPTRVRSIRGTR